MKKSFSLFALGAIVIAVASAFSTKSNLAIDRWERFGVNNNTVTASSPANSVYAQKRSDAFALTSTSALTNITTEISNYNFANPSKPVSCASDATFMCAAIVSYDHLTPSTKTLVDFDLGDYSIVP